MILVTVGMQLGFDRLIAEMDRLAPELGMEVIAQTGKGEYEAVHMEQHEKIAPAEFEALAARAKVIVSHAGIGTVLTAQRMEKPIVLFPRRLEHGEHRNDHQMATVESLKGRSGIIIAMTEADLKPAIEEALKIGAAKSERSKTANGLHNAVARFIETGAL
ncbi:MAG: glycosyltransferase [Pseudomonadota bacterium]|nr:glycosyltransferase [Pseudomonadota bacterium]